MKPAQRDFLQKIRKFVATAEELRSGRQNYFSITRLLSIKSLCKETQTAARFVFFLAQRSLEKAQNGTRPNSSTEDEWENSKRLMSEAVEAMGLHLQQPTEETLAALRKLKGKIYALQPYAGEKVRGTQIRTIRYWNALIVEEALDCILTPHAAPEMAYMAARHFAERYNASYGTGLIPESVPMLEDIIQFWSAHGPGNADDWLDVLADASRPPKKTGAARSADAKAQHTSSGAGSRRKPGKSFAERHPVVADWVRENGWIEIGHSEHSHAFIRVLDEGGLIWQGKSKYRSLDDALDDAEQAIRARLGV